MMLSSHEAREQTALLVERPSRKRQIMANIFNPFQEILVQPEKNFSILQHVGMCVNLNDMSKIYSDTSKLGIGIGC